MGRILIIGGGGFIGRNLIERLYNDGQEINVVDLKRPEWLPVDVNCFEVSFISRSIELCAAFENIDTVYHLASTTLPQSSNENPVFDIESNLVGTLNLLDIAVENNVSKFIFTSSGGTIYGPSSEACITEEHPTNPICSYGIVKLAIEKYLKLYSDQYGLQTYSLRISNPYGRYQDFNKSQGVIPVFMHKIMNNEPIEIWGDGSIARDFIYIDDVIDAMILTASLACKSEVFNISSSLAIEINNIVRLLEIYLKNTAYIKYTPQRSVDVKYSCLSNIKAKKILKWDPSFDLQSGLKILSEHFVI